MSEKGVDRVARVRRRRADSRKSGDIDERVGIHVIAQYCGRVHGVIAATPHYGAMVAVGSGRPAEHAQVFGQVADIYDRARPGYPAAAVEWLVGGPPRRVLDLGAGTGKLTATLVTAGHDVIAVDPSPQMLAVLRSANPRAAALEGRAEAIPLPDADVDTVIVAQAFHWFDHTAAVPEIARVLRPGGRLALVWNLRDESTPWVAELSRIIGSQDASPVEVAPALRAAHTQFDQLETAQFRHTQRLDRDMLVSLVRSRSYIAVRSAVEQAETVAEVVKLFDRFAESSQLVLPYVTRCYRATRGMTTFTRADSRGERGHS